MEIKMTLRFCLMSITFGCSRSHISVWTQLEGAAAENFANKR